jgi:ribose transport system permease protein
MPDTPRTSTLPAAPPRRGLPVLAWLVRYSVIIAFALVCAFFAAMSPTFLTPANLLNVLVNNVALLAIVALGMTFVVASGGIDLSVGTSVDMASMVFIMLMAAGAALGLGLAAGLLAASLVGVVNGLLITRLRISPFLATLGVLFIGQSVQQLSTNGGQPIYLVTSQAAEAFAFIGHGRLLGIPLPLWVVFLAYLTVHLLLNDTPFGRHVRALGAQPGVAWYSGLRTRRDTIAVYALCAFLCGLAGIIVSCTVRSYVPLSGNAFLLDAIGATFIGTTLSAERRPNVAGTLIGVVLLGTVKNGLLLIGWNFYWQQVGTGVLIFLVLAVSFATRRLPVGGR